ncbi:phosphatase PAP2 family protein [Saccharopolyspora sp. MS10]|uniref:phosphatase PAP2 family protein n=1 Tax=Saccharopolyspora sp. MS10 TaxID=3385973 RepID=UPI0039A2FD11
MPTSPVHPTSSPGANPYVPDLSTDWYRGIAGAGAASPEWLRAFSEFFTEAAIIGFLAAFAALIWLARRRDHRAAAGAALTVGVTALAYVVSEVVKSFVQEDRPCRVVAHAQAIATCPEFGDWSFPSNHSTIAAASAVAIFCVRPAWGRIALVVGVLTGLSRVFVGVHYPHDVLVGLLLGGLVAALLPWLAGLLSPVVAGARRTSIGVLALGPGPDDEDATVQLPVVEDATVRLPAVRESRPPVMREPRPPVMREPRPPAAGGSRPPATRGPRPPAVRDPRR